MHPIPPHAQNLELFTAFYGLQSDFAACLAAHPGLVRRWLEALPPRRHEAAETARRSRTWRTSALSSGRRRELGALIARAEVSQPETASLAEWLLAAVPVRTYFEIAAVAGPGLPAFDLAAADCHHRLIGLRDRLFLTNYGLAKAAARRFYHLDYGDVLSAASFGLLDAVDRYVPSPRAARFSYFAGYWIRYHVARQSQKFGSVISFPVNQHRIGRRIRRYLADREASALPPPSPQELCSDLQLGRAALHLQRRRPHMVSLHAPAGPEPQAVAMEHCLCDPAPAPAAILEGNETADRLRLILHHHATPATRVMLAYARSVGALADAAEEYLAGLQETALARLGNDREIERPMKIAS
jgi:hypothetical protein